MTYKTELTVEGHEWTTLPEHIKDKNDMVRIMAMLVSETSARLIDLHIGCRQEGVIDETTDCPMFEDIFDEMVDLAAKCDSLIRRLEE